MYGSTDWFSATAASEEGPYNAIYGTVDGEGIYATADEGIYEIVT